MTMVVRVNTRDTTLTMRPISGAGVSEVSGPAVDWLMNPPRSRGMVLAGCVVGTLSVCGAVVGGTLAVFVSSEIVKFN